MHGTSALGRGATTGATIRLRRDVYDRLVQARGIQLIQEQVEFTGVPRRTLYRIVRGQPPSFANAMRIATALGAPIDALFERLGE